MEKGTKTGVRSGHNRKWSRDHIKRMDSLLRMNFCREVEACTPPLFQQSCTVKQYFPGILLFTTSERDEKDGRESERETLCRELRLR